MWVLRVLGVISAPCQVAEGQDRKALNCLLITHDLFLVLPYLEL